MAEHVEDDFEDSRYYPNEGDGVQYATVEDIRQYDGDDENCATNETPVTAAAEMSEKDRKKEAKRLEKERKEKEKKEKQLLKEQERLIKQEAKLKKSPSLKKTESTRASKTSRTAASPQKTEARPKNAVACRVQMLDGSDYEFEIKKTAKGQLLLDMVYEYVNLLEREYFSCFYIREDTRFWLIGDRKIAKQLGKLPWIFYFGVKFYPPEPSKLSEDITRYQLCLQMRMDILCGRLPCSQVTSALLGAFTVQAELGDFDPSEFGTGIDYLQEFEFCPDQTPELLGKIAQLHRTLRGRTPADAELDYMENVKKLEMYGVELQPAKDAELVNIAVGVSAMGIVVYRDQIRVNRFPWPLVLKLAYKSDKFYVKIRPAECQRYITTLVFKMPNHDLAKRFWRLALEHHSFFRLKQPNDLNRSMFSRFGSSQSRFSGRTYYQSQLYTSTVQRPAPDFDRVSSHQLTMMSRSMGSSFMDESMRKAQRKPTDNIENVPPSYEQVGVVAGNDPSGLQTNRMAFVKTIRSGDIEQPTGRIEISQPSRDAAVHYPSETTSPDTSFNQSTEQSARAYGPPVVAKKKTVTTETKVHVVTEYKSEKNGVVETQIERRQVAGRADTDHDMELSKAIHSAMDMSADLSVDKIEINPSNIACSMVGTGDEQTIEIAPVKTKKTKKKNNKREVIVE